MSSLKVIVFICFLKISSIESASRSLPISLNLNDVMIKINVPQMQNGEILRIFPVVNEKDHLLSKNVSVPEVSNNYDPCSNGNCSTRDYDDYYDPVDPSTKVLNDEEKYGDNLFKQIPIVSNEKSDQKSIFSSNLLNLVFTAPGLSTTYTPTYEYSTQSQWATSGGYPRCAGTKQSPVQIPDITTPVTRGACLIWQNYHSFHRYLTLTNNGHSVYASSTWSVGTIPELSGGPLVGKYRFGGIHWHWAATDNLGAEHKIGNTNSPLEMHFVHYSTRYSTLSDALNAHTDPEALAVVGILFKLSLLSNPGMSVLVAAMERATAQGTQSTVLPLGNLGVNFKDGFYTYSGSITSPPCNENVRWIVLRKKLHITRLQLNVFRSVLANGKPILNNYRDIQPLNGRTIEYHRYCYD